jgi:hypothetical protein
MRILCFTSATAAAARVPSPGTTDTVRDDTDVETAKRRQARTAEVG